MHCTQGCRFEKKKLKEEEKEKKSNKAEKERKKRPIIALSTELGEVVARRRTLTFLSSLLTID